MSFLQKHKAFPYTIALYESCHRIAAAVDEIVLELGETRVITVAKEVTKLHETFLVGPAKEVQEKLSKITIKGEFVLLIAPEEFVL